MEKVRVTTSGKGTNGQIVVTAPNYSRTIPAVLFSDKEAQALLEIVDRVEMRRNIMAVTNKKIARSAKLRKIGWAALVNEKSSRNSTIAMTED